MASDDPVMWIQGDEMSVRGSLLGRPGRGNRRAPRLLPDTPRGHGASPPGACWRPRGGPLILCYAVKKQIKKTKIFYVMQQCLWAGNRPSGPDFGRTATGNTPKSALRPAFGRPVGRFRCFPGSGPAKILRNCHETVLESVSRGSVGRFMERFSSRGRW